MNCIGDILDVENFKKLHDKIEGLDVICHTYDKRHIRGRIISMNESMLFLDRKPAKDRGVSFNNIKDIEFLDSIPQV